MSPAPGEIWLADLGMAAKTRPVLIVSRRDPEAPRALVIYVPLTSQHRGSPYEVPMPKLSFLREVFISFLVSPMFIPRVAKISGCGAGSCFFGNVKNCSYASFRHLKLSSKAWLSETGDSPYSRFHSVKIASKFKC